MLALALVTVLAWFLIVIVAPAKIPRHRPDVGICRGSGDADTVAAASERRRFTFAPEG